MKPKTVNVVTTMTVAAIILISIMAQTVYRNTKCDKCDNNSALMHDDVLEGWFG